MKNDIYGITSYQQQLIDCALDPDVSRDFHSAMTLAWAYRATPALKPRTLDRAFHKLVKRHDSLRIKFVQDRGQWKAWVRPEHPSGLRVEDLSRLPDDAEEAAIVALAQEPMTALSEALFEIVLIQSGARGSIILVRAHHSIIDGYGVTVLMEDFLKLAFGLPVLSRAVSHREFIALQDRRLAKDGAKKDAFWNEMFADPLPRPNLGCFARGLQPASARMPDACGTFANILTDEQSQALDRRVRTTGISAFSYIFSAYGSALCECGGVKEVLVASVMGRQETALANFVGPDIQEFALRYRMSPAGLDARAKLVRALLAEASEALPYDAFHQPSHELRKRMHTAGTLTNAFFIAMAVPTVRFSQAGSANMVDLATSKRISLGYMTLERIDLPFDSVFSEILLSVSQEDTGPNLTMRYQKRAYDEDEAKAIADRMVHHLSS